MVPCYVVNLEKDAERRENISSQLETLAIPYTIFKAVYGKALSAEEMAQHYDERRAIREHRRLVPGEIGCALSHLGIYREMVEKDQPSALILEDDASLMPEPSDGDAKKIPWLPDVLTALEKRFHCDDPVVVLLSYVKRYHKRSDEPLVGDVRVADVYRAAFGTYAYFITRGAAKNLMENNYPVSRPCDHWTIFQNSGYIKLKMVMPYCVSHKLDRSDSSINAERKIAKKEEKRKLSRSLYRRFFFPIFVRPFFASRQKKAW